MIEQPSSDLQRGGLVTANRWSLKSLALAPLQPLLLYIVGQVAAECPEILERLGPHRDTRFLIDPVDLPFALLLRPMPGDLVLRACIRSEVPAHDARIVGKLLDLVRLIDCEEDGDAMFFSRGLSISGDTEAVVTLRNALDDVEGSIAARVADLLGPPGRAALALLRRVGGWQEREESTRP